MGKEISRQTQCSIRVKTNNKKVEKEESSLYCTLAKKPGPCLITTCCGIKSFNDTIAAAELGPEWLLLAVVHFSFIFSFSARPHPVSEGSGLKSRSGPLDQTHRSGLSANHTTWLPKKLLLQGQMTHSRGMIKLRCQLRAHKHIHPHTQGLQHPVMCSSVSDFRSICHAEDSLCAERTQDVAAAVWVVQLTRKTLLRRLGLLL